MKKLLFILLIAVVAAGCKKEKKIEKNLWKNGGEWEIKSFEESYTSASTPEYNYSFIINNGGTIQFNKDGTGMMNYTSELATYMEEIVHPNPFSSHLSIQSPQKDQLILKSIEGRVIDNYEIEKGIFKSEHYELIRWHIHSHLCQ